MGYSRYVGRVGALAVALGVGFAVANSPGIALADETGTANTDPATGATTPGPADNPVPGATGTDPSPGGGGVDPTGPTSAPGTGTTTGTTTQTTVIGGGTTPQVTISANGTVNPPAGGEPTHTETATPTPTQTPEPTATPISTQTPDPTTAQQAPPTPVEQSPPQGTPAAGGHFAAPGAATPSTASAASPPPGGNNLLAARVLNVPAANDVLDSTHNQGQTAFNTTAFQTESANVEQVTAPAAPTPTTGLAAIPGALISITTNLLSAVLAPFMAPDPAGPTDAPLVWGLLAWVRRQFENTFINHTPTLDPVQTSLVVDEDGEVHGTLGPADPDDDQLTYWTTSDPVHGTVSIDQVNRTWTYKADAGYIGPDSFTVKVSDGQLIHGLFGFLAPDFGATDTATVAVNASKVPFSIDNADVHGDPVGPLILSPDGQRAYQLSRVEHPQARTTNELTIVNTADGSVYRRLTIEGGLPDDNLGLVVSPDGTHAVVATNQSADLGTIYLVDLTDPDLTAADIALAGTKFFGGVDDVRFSPDSKHAYVLHSYKTNFGLSTVDVQTHDVTIASLTADRAQMRVAPDGSSVMVTSTAEDPGGNHALDRDFLSLLDPATGEFVHDPVDVTGYFFDYVGSTAVGYQRNSTTFNILVATLDGLRASSMTNAGFSGHLENIFANPDGSLFFTYTKSDRVVMSTLTNGTFRTIDIPGTITGLGGDATTSADGKLIYITTVTTAGNGSPQTQMNVIDTADLLSLRAPIVAAGAPYDQYDTVQVNDSKTRALLFTSNDHDKDLRVTVVDLATGTALGTQELTSGRHTYQFGVDGTRAYVIGRVFGSADAAPKTAVTILDLTTGKIVGAPALLDGVSNRIDGTTEGFVESIDGTRAFQMTYSYTNGVFDGGNISVIDLVNSRQIGNTIHIDTIPAYVEPNADKTILALHTSKHSITFADAAGHVVTVETGGEDDIYDNGVQYDNHGRAYISTRWFDNDDDDARIITVETTSGQYQVIDSFDIYGAFSTKRPPILTPDDSRLLVENFNGIRTYDTGARPLATPPVLPDPAAPPNLIESIFGQIQRTFFNGTPTLHPVQHTVIVRPDGTIVGTLGADDAEGDRLVYKVTEAPEHGTVTVDQATGTWTYAPTGTYRGPDTFVVEASDATGLHIHGLGGFFTADGGYTTSAVVNVNVATKPFVLPDTADIDEFSGNTAGDTVLSPDGRRAYQLFENAVPDAHDSKVGLIVVDTATGQKTHEIVVDGYLVDDQPLVVSADGRTALLVTQVQPGADGRSTQTEVRLIDLTTDIDEANFEPTPVDGKQVDTRGLVLSADGRRAYLTTWEFGVSGGHGQVTIVDFDQRRVVAQNTFTQGIIPAQGVVETPDGTRIIAVGRKVNGDASITAYIYDSHTGAQLGASEAFARDGAELETLELSEDGEHALLEISGTTATDNHTIRVIDTRTGETTVATSRLTSRELIEFGGTGSRLYIRSNGEPAVDDDSVTVFDTNDGTVLADNVELPGSLRDFRYADDGTGYFAYTGALSDGGSQLTIIGAAGEVTRIALHGSAKTDSPGAPIQFNDDQSLAFVTTQDDSGAPDFVGTTHVMVIDTSSKTALRTIDVRGFAAGHDYAIQANPDHSSALLVTRDHSSYYTTVIDLRSGTVVGSPRLISEGDSTRTTLFSPAGDKAVVVIRNEPSTGTASTVVAVIDLRTGAVARTEIDGAFRPPSADDAGVILSADGSRGFIITHLEDGSATATSVDLGTATVGVAARVDGEPTAVELDASGRVAAIHTDGAVTIVDAEGHSAVLHSPGGADGGDSWVTFSDDGTRAYVSTGVDRADPDDVFPDLHNVIRVVAIGAQGISVIAEVELDGSAWEPVIVSQDGGRAVMGASTSLFGFTHAIYTIDTGQASTQIV